MELTQLSFDYEVNGFVTGLDILTEDEARVHRASLEKAEAQIGPLHYKAKVHTILHSPYELATHPRVLDIVRVLIGPDILLYDVAYIIKEPHATSHVSWHQDLTYWGLSDDVQVSMWLALSPATCESGCMRMIPGSHKSGRLEHKLTKDTSNVLFQGQTVDGVAEEQAVVCPLLPGQASFHHGWTLHDSGPNASNDRRIGLNVQYIAPQVRQIKHNKDSAMLVYGQDAYHNFKADWPAGEDLQPEALERWRELDRLHIETQSSS